MCRILSIISMLAVLFLAQASAQYSYTPHALCSDRLNDMLMMVCEEFNGNTPQKRGLIAGDLDLLDPVQYVEATESRPIFRGRFHGGDGALNSLAPIRRLTRQGIVDRCCKRSCSMEVLMEYCSVPRI
ncbi:probable insulin-like peptide 2 [Drosophila kikkawai]|uniref:Probable insulin-like peptide 2 n=1 Tax=Drosophila kikkawai TaxID=30033 RepID=A0A6P4IEQ5_DROKI|nr:probable insulin-like peptide 2 [Drosophila kikkawai]KAH8322944.1 hypothetical protein KR059_011611 [Drosophila kikkawai]